MVNGIKLISLSIFIFFAFAEEIKINTDDKPIFCTSEKLEYIFKDEKRIVIAKGNVKLSYEDITLYADEIQLDLITQEVNAKGNIILKEKENEVYATSIIYNLVKKTGNISNVKIITKPWVLIGKRIVKSSENDFILEDGVMTTCNKEYPHFHYHLAARKVHVEIGKKIEANNVIFKIGQIPLFWFPYLSRSLEDRRSPFIIKPGYSTSEGVTIKTTYNYSIPPLNGEVYVDYLSNHGIGTGMTKKYETKNGLVIGSGYYFQDKKLNRTRWNTNINFNQSLISNLYLNGALNLVSDESLFPDVYISPVVSRAIQSRGSITYNSPYYTFIVSLEEYDSWDQNEKKYKPQERSMPRIIFNSSSFPIFSSLYGRFGIEFFRHYTFNTTTMWKGKFNQELTNSLRITNYNTLNTSFSWYTFWQEKSDSITKEYTHYYSISNVLHNIITEFLRIDLTHLFQQRVMDSYEVDINKLRYGIFIQYQDKFFFSSTSGYDFKSKEEGMKKFDDIISELSVRYIINYFLSTRYSLSTNQINSVDTYMKLDKDKFHVSLGVNWQKSYTNAVDVYGEITFPIFDIADINISTRYDIVNEILKEQKYAITFNITDCWAFSGAYSKQMNIEHVFVNIWLRAFPPSTQLIQR
jgi:lipopolysaccharide assembly outer membrane protein LptD (OstA)